MTSHSFERAAGLLGLAANECAGVYEGRKSMPQPLTPPQDPEA
jgi:hypothetical protein